MPFRNYFLYVSKYSSTTIHSRPILPLATVHVAVLPFHSLTYFQNPFRSHCLNHITFIAIHSPKSFPTVFKYLLPFNLALHHPQFSFVCFSSPLPASGVFINGFPSFTAYHTSILDANWWKTAEGQGIKLEAPVLLFFIVWNDATDVSSAPPFRPADDASGALQHNRQNQPLNHNHWCDLISICANVIVWLHEVPWVPKHLPHHRWPPSYFADLPSAGVYELDLWQNMLKERQTPLNLPPPVQTKRRARIRQLPNSKMVSTSPLTSVAPIIHCTRTSTYGSHLTRSSTSSSYVMYIQWNLNSLMVPFRGPAFMTSVASSLSQTFPLSPSLFNSFDVLGKDEQRQVLQDGGDIGVMHGRHLLSVM